MAYTVLVLEVLQQRLGQEGKIDVLVRARPHAITSRLVAILDDGSMKIDLAAPADDGKANAALAAFIGELFDVPSFRVKILSGKTARLKLVRIIGTDPMP